MAGWKKSAIGDIPLFQSRTIAWLPGIVQGFTTRHGGISVAPYDSLNLSSKVGDNIEYVTQNRERLWNDLGYSTENTVTAEQVHGAQVAVVGKGSDIPAPDSDALITNEKGILLTLLFADCVPVYLIDPVGKSIGLAHAGWRGTAAGVIVNTVTQLTSSFGTDPYHCLAAIGPCIGADSYEVGIEVADKFRNSPGGMNTGAANTVMPKDEMAGKYLLNLRQVIYMQLLACGIRADYITVCDEDTFKNKRDFFSYRRDGAKTGRMAAFLGFKK